MTLEEDPKKLESLNKEVLARYQALQANLGAEATPNTPFINEQALRELRKEGSGL